MFAFDSKEVCHEGACGVIVIVVRKGLGDLSSNPGHSTNVLEKGMLQTIPLHSWVKCWAEYDNRFQRRKTLKQTC